MGSGKSSNPTVWTTSNGSWIICLNCASVFSSLKLMRLKYLPYRVVVNIKLGNSYKMIKTVPETL